MVREAAAAAGTIAACPVAATTGPHAPGVRSRPRLTLRCWGVRGTAPAPGAHTARYGGHTMCVEAATADGTTLFLDAGSGLAPALRSRDRHAVEAPRVVLTHLHLDHLLGIPALLAPGVGTADGPATIVSAHAPADAARDAIRALLAPPYYPDIGAEADGLRVVGMLDDTAADAGAGLTVERLPARHPGGAAILRLADRGGPLLAFAPDNELDYAGGDAEVAEWRDGLAATLRGIPVLLHDAMWDEDELPARRGWGHSSALEATRFAMACDAGLLLLVHHHPERSDDAIETLTARCREHVRQAGGAVRVLAAWDGLALMF
jgi:ribonuclease BN (tRNA processing enzyme)